MLIASLRWGLSRLGHWSFGYILYLQHSVTEKGQMAFSKSIFSVDDPILWELDRLFYLLDPTNYSLDVFIYSNE